MSTNSFAPPGAAGRHMEELLRLAEFGRIHASLLHDLANPLAAAALCLQDTNARNPSNLQRARRNIENLQRFVSTARRQISCTDERRYFSVNSEVQNVRDALQPIAFRSGVNLRFIIPSAQVLYGNPVKFQRIAMNLVANGIEASARRNERDYQPHFRERCVTTRAFTNPQHMVLVVEDHGTGIRRDHMPYIFNQFYSTKNTEEKAWWGSGIGLHTAKRFIEQDFKGSIAVSSRPGRGSTFRCKFPLRKAR